MDVAEYVGTSALTSTFRPGSDTGPAGAAPACQLVREWQAAQSLPLMSGCVKVPPPAGVNGSAAKGAPTAWQSAQPAAAMPAWSKASRLPSGWQPRQLVAV